MFVRDTLRGKALLTSYTRFLDIGAFLFDWGPAIQSVEDSGHVDSQLDPSTYEPEV